MKKHRGGKQVNPALKSLLVKESQIESNDLSDHVEIIKKKKNQELCDYIMVCLHRLQAQALLQERSSNMSETHGVLCRTLESWRD